MMNGAVNLLDALPEPYEGEYAETVMSYRNESCARSVLWRTCRAVRCEFFHADPKDEAIWEDVEETLKQLLALVGE